MPENESSMGDITNNSKVSIRLATAEDHDGIRSFIRDHVRSDHPITQPWLFDWLYKGFGVSGDQVRSVILEAIDGIVGFRGLIPVEFQIPRDGDLSVHQGATYAFWNIREDLRGRGFGLRMHEEMINCGIVSGLGSNRATSVPIYIKNGWNYLDSLHRYVRPLDLEAYSLLLPAASTATWDLCPKLPDEVKPVTPDPALLSDVWQRTTSTVGIYSQHRSEEFWKWRYIENEGFRYFFFGDISTGFIVARAEVIYSSSVPAIDGRRVLRIIEVVPKDAALWGRKDDVELSHILGGVLSWARRLDCIAADFYCTHSRFSNLFGANGFRLQTRNSPECDMAHWMQPFSHSAEPLNGLFRIDSRVSNVGRLNFEDIHMVKAENDQDRPNLCETAMDLDTADTYKFHESHSQKVVLS